MKLKNCPNPECLSENVVVEYCPSRDSEFPYQVLCLDCGTSAADWYQDKTDAKKDWNQEDVDVCSYQIFTRKEKD